MTVHRGLMLIQSGAQIVRSVRRATTAKARAQKNAKNARPGNTQQKGKTSVTYVRKEHLPRKMVHLSVLCALSGKLICSITTPQSGSAG